jgi:hypothetical protein
MSGNTQYLYIGNQNEPLSQLNGYASGSFTIGKDIPGDPAYGCPKNFVANYMCGATPKSFTIPGEAGGKKAIFNCRKEVEKCSNTPTLALLQNDGNAVIYNGTIENYKDPRWSSQTAGKMSANDGTNLIKGETLYSNMPTNSQLQPGPKLTNPNQNGTFYINKDGNVKIDKYELNQSKDAQGNIVGNGGDNTSFALYEINPKKPASNLFKTGYVDIDSNLQIYPDNMLEYKNSYSKIPNTNAPGYDIADLGNIGQNACEQNCNARNNCGAYQMNSDGHCWIKTGDAYAKGNVIQVPGMDTYLRMKGPLTRNFDYTNYPNKDSPGNDIKCTNPGEVNSKKELELLCNKDPNCAAYNWNQNQKTGCMKNDSAYSDNNKEASFETNNNYEYNVKQKSGASNTFLGSCSQDVVGINSERWSAYVKGPPMTPTTKCGLARITEKDKRQLEISEKKLNDMAAKMKTRIKTLTSKENKLNKYYINYYNKIEKELKNFKKEYAAYKKNKKETENVESWNEDSEIQMISYNNKYTIFSIVAIIMVVALIKITRKSK